jgi:hypothetical protein
MREIVHTMRRTASAGEDNWDESSGASRQGAVTVGHDVKLYDGSFQDWELRGLPIESSRKSDK